MSISGLVAGSSSKVAPTLASLGAIFQTIRPKSKEKNPEANMVVMAAAKERGPAANCMVLSTMTPTEVRPCTVKKTAMARIRIISN